MILFISNSGESLPIVWRLRQEGVNAVIYIHHPQYRRNYDGLLPKVRISELKKALRKVDTIVFDITRPNEKIKEDVALLKMFKCKTGSSNVFGPVADRCKKYHRVIGCSEWTENLEMNRMQGIDLARKIGLLVPESHEFKTLKEGMKFLKDRKERWVFKPFNNQDLDLTYVEKWPGELLRKFQGEYESRIPDKLDFLLQRVIDGVEISTEGWWNGNKFIHFNHTIEDKRLMNANLGPPIGSQNNTVWIKKDMAGLLVQEIQKLRPYLQSAEYIGPIDINAIVAQSDGKPYFLEFTPRFGYDAIYCLLNLVNGKISDFFKKDFDVQFHKGYASSARISIPPYPYATPKLLSDFAKDVHIEGKLEKMPSFWAEDIYLNNGLSCCGADGILGVVASRGNSLGGSVGNVYRAIEGMKIASHVQYRTDLGRRAEKAIRTLEKWGVSIG